MYSVGITKIKGGSKGLVATIPVKSLWPPSEESPPPLPLFQCCSNDVDFSFDIFSNLQNNIGQGVWGKKEATVQCYCLRLLLSLTTTTIATSILVHYIKFSFPEFELP